MWLFARNGFYSAVQNKDDPDLIHVRGRFEGDIERLLTAHGVKEGGLEASKVKVQKYGDYGYSCEIRRKTFAKIVKEEAESIDYTNFKSSCPDYGFPGRHVTYLDVWSVLRRAQREAKQTKVAYCS